MHKLEKHIKYSVQLTGKMDEGHMICTYLHDDHTAYMQGYTWQQDEEDMQVSIDLSDTDSKEEVIIIDSAGSDSDCMETAEDIRLPPAKKGTQYLRRTRGNQHAQAPGSRYYQQRTSRQHHQTNDASLTIPDRKPGAEDVSATHGTLGGGWNLYTGKAPTQRYKRYS